MAYLSDPHETLFKRTLRFSLGFYLLAAALVTVIRIPLPEQSDVKDLPDRVAKLLLEPPPMVSTPPSTKVTEPPKEEVRKREERSRPSAQQTREIVRKRGLLASLIAEENKGGLNALLDNERLDRALSSVDLISTPVQQKSARPSFQSQLSHKTDLAEKKIAQLGTLKESDRVKLAKGEEVSLARLQKSPSGNGPGTGGENALGNGVGIRLKGSRSGSPNAFIDYDAIARVVEQYKGGLVYLYNKELRTNPTLKGTITVEFSIDASGKVVEAHVVSSTMDHEPLEKALAQRIKMWKFPHLYDGTIVVTYPFVFFPV